MRHHRVRYMLRQLRKLKTILPTTTLLIASGNAIGAVPEDGACVKSIEDREYIRSLALQGIDQALRDQVAHLFEIWVRDPAAAPARASAGMQIALGAYHRSRENTLNWNPPICDEKGKKP